MKNGVNLRSPYNFDTDKRLRFHMYIVAVIVGTSSLRYMCLHFISGLPFRTFVAAAVAVAAFTVDDDDDYHHYSGIVVARSI